jgi:hypothetical protein
MRRQWLTLCASVAAALSQAHAQPTAPGMRLADSVEFGVQHFAKLFAGIPLSAERQASAERAIRSSFVAQLQTGGPISKKENWDKIVAVQERRDSILVALVRDRAKRKILIARLIADRPKKGNGS